MSLNREDLNLLLQLEKEDREVTNMVTDAAGACRRELEDQGIQPLYDDAHAALDAAVYRYLLACRAKAG